MVSVLQVICICLFASVHQSGCLAYVVVHRSFYTCIVVSLLLSYFCVLPTRIWVRYYNHFCCKTCHRKRIVYRWCLLAVPTERQERSRMFRNVYGVLLERWHVSIGHSSHTNQDPKLAFFEACLVIISYLFRWFWRFVSISYHLSYLSQKLISWKKRSP